MHQRRLGKYAPHRAQTWAAYHCHHDVRVRRRAAPSRQSFRAHSPHSGRHRRLHRIHPVDFRFRQHAARKKSSGNYGCRLFENARRQPPLPRQHRSHPIELAYSRHQSLPGRPAIRRRRRWQHLDRRKCRVRRRRSQSHQRRRTSPRDLRCRLHPRPARHPLPFLRPEIKTLRILMQKISPFLWFDSNAEEAANFYVAIFKDSKILKIARYGEAGPGPAGSVMIVHFQIEGQEFIALNGGPQFKFTEAISFCINCQTQEEVDYFWNKLTADGGQEVQCGWLKDKFGVSWQVVPTVLIEMLHDKNSEKSERVMQEMLQMTKIDIDKLKAAYE